MDLLKLQLFYLQGKATIFGARNLHLKPMKTFNAGSFIKSLLQGQFSGR